MHGINSRKRLGVVSRNNYGLMQKDGRGRASINIRPAGPEPEKDC